MSFRFIAVLCAAILPALTSCEIVGPDNNNELPPISSVDVSPAIPPQPATPEAHELAWQRGEMYMFIHFGMNTMTGRQWGTGKEDPASFSPSGVDARQWARVAKEAGFKGIIFTAKHHEGFALWPTAYSDFSIESSPWQDGKGDIVKQVADACRAYGILFGVYLSPWDMHEPTYNTPAYNDFYTGQMTELLSNYGPVFEVWMDGAHAEGAGQHYDWGRWIETIRRLQPEAFIWGTDGRWVGNEQGIAPETNWSAMYGTWWHPAECNTTNRPSWFWDAGEDTRLKTPEELLDIYYSSVGRNCPLLLNLPPNRAGVFPEADVQNLMAFRARLDEIFDEDLAVQGRATASNVRANHEGWSPQNAVDGKEATFWATDDSVHSGWLALSFEDQRVPRFNVIKLQEPIQYGQRVAAYRIEVWNGSEWQIVSRGTTIGYKKIDRIPAVESARVRLVIESTAAGINPETNTLVAPNSAPPAIEAFSLYYDPKAE